MIEVREINLKEEVSIQQVSELLDDNAEIHGINLVNWQKFPYHPDVRFRIAHSNNQIWLKFYVHEENILAHRTQTNSSTHMDSCVEFFWIQNRMVIIIILNLIVLGRFTLPMDRIERNVNLLNLVL